MKFQEFIQACENNAVDLYTRNVIRETENRIIQSEPNPVEEWSQNQHKEAIQKAKQHFDMRGIEYISC